MFEALDPYSPWWWLIPIVYFLIGIAAGSFVSWSVSEYNKKSHEVGESFLIIFAIWPVVLIMVIFEALDEFSYNSNPLKYFTAPFGKIQIKVRTRQEQRRKEMLAPLSEKTKEYL